MAPEEFRMYSRRPPRTDVFDAFRVVLFAGLLVLLVVNHNAAVSFWANNPSSRLRYRWMSDFSLEWVLVWEAMLTYLTVWMVLRILRGSGRIPLVIATGFPGHTTTVRMPFSRPFLRSQSLVLHRDVAVGVTLVRRYAKRELALGIRSGGRVIVRILDREVDVEQGILFVDWLNSRGHEALGVAFGTRAPLD